MTVPVLIREHGRAFREARARQVVPLQLGTAYLNPAFPKMYDLNFVCISDPSASFAEASSATDRVLSEAGARHRKFVVDGEAHGERLAAGAAPGWTTTCLLDMTWNQDPDRADAPAVELTLEDLRDHRERLHRAAYGNEEELIRQFLERDRLYRRAVGARFFGARDDDGMVRCSLNLITIGTVAEIDDLQTEEEARGRGYAAAAVLAASRAAVSSGARLVFLTADEDDWPKEMYARLGFVPAGRRYEFLLKP